MSYARKIDQNHNQIAAALRAAGAWVWSTAALGNGFPDLLVWFRGAYTLLEVKRVGPPSSQKLTEAEGKFMRSCPGAYFVVSTPGAALTAIGASGFTAQEAIANWEADRARRNGGGA